MNGRRAAPREPRATYRLQFHRGFTFRDATRLTPYLAALGVSHIYASPLTEARPGSTHGYDITDYNRLNPEIGSEADFCALVDALHAHGMGLILDFVPNHMGIGADNAWWRDVLAWGRDSPFARYFDINWHALRPDLEGRVLLPVLGDQYGAILERGDIKLLFDTAAGSFSLGYFEHRFPISPRTCAPILAAGGGSLAGLARDFAALGALPAAAARDRAAALQQALAEFARHRGAADAIAAALRHFEGQPGEPDSFLPLHRLIEAQAYRIAHWRVAADEINYRRFFNINDLAGLRMEEPALFEQAHRLLFALIERGDVQGVRIDHIDGLFDPCGYCERLRQHFATPVYVLVEKILAAYESLPDWPVAGTTGYDFTNQVLAIFVDPDGEKALDRIYRRFSGRRQSYEDILYASKLRIMRVNLASEMNVLAREFHALSMRDWRTRDFTLNGMLAALEETVAAFPVYRTYVAERGAGADDRRYIDWALAQAKKRWRGADVSIFDFLRGVLTGDGRDQPDADALRTAMHFQQVTGPVMAKAAEDTAFYRYVRLVALNEVGGDPRRFGISVAAFHRLTRDRARSWPQAMVTTATHDTKRGEDARARLALLSEMPREWGRRLGRWLRLNRSRRAEIDGAAVPERNVEYLFYQALLGAWPPALVPDDAAGISDLARRLDEYMIKAVREAKENTSWSNPDPDYEAALRRFVGGVLDVSRPNPFLAEFHGFVLSLARPAAVTALAQLVLKLTVPGVPDIYQGGELWDFDLVDPDNRRPIDWETRRALLHAVAGARPADLAESWPDGREKLFVTHRLLALRGGHPELFAAGDYQPLETLGDRAEHLCAFTRSHGDERIAVAVPRLVYRLCQRDPDDRWGNTEIALPPATVWRDIFACRRIESRDKLRAAELFAEFPVAVLIADNA
jgi:(1->4)-alpha-D-glucan 1-alpha-D-glucosylmutase